MDLFPSMKITIYTITDCQFSKQEKDYLTSHNLPFDEKNLEVDKAYLTEMLAISNNFAGTPVTKIEKDNGQSVVLKGFTKAEFDKELGFGEASTPQQTAPAAAPQGAPDAKAPVTGGMPAPLDMPAAPAPAPVAPAPVPEPVSMPAPAPMEMPAAPMAQAPAAPAAPANFPSMPEAPAAMPQQPVSVPQSPAPQAPVAQPPAAPAPKPVDFQNDPSIDALLKDLQQKSAQAQSAPAAAPASNFPAIPDPQFNKNQ